MASRLLLLLLLNREDLLSSRVAEYFLFDLPEAVRIGCVAAELVLHSSVSAAVQRSWFYPDPETARRTGSMELRSFWPVVAGTSCAVLAALRRPPPSRKSRQLQTVWEVKRVVK